MKKSPRKLDPRGREFQPYLGDWERLTELLAPKRIKPGTFVREMISKVLQNAAEGRVEQDVNIGALDLEVES